MADHEPLEPQPLEQRGIMRRIIRWLVKRYYPRLDISGAERIARTGPVLLCANHANSLIDPVLIGIAANRPVRFMAKAPLFDSPLFGPPMRALGMIPAYRGSDDAKQVRRNVESLDVGSKVLVDGHAMGIFPEGVSTDHAHLEKVRSGASRMAIGAAEQGAKGVQVVPIGMTYQIKEQFRSAVWIQVGRPIDVDEWIEQHDGNGRKAMRAMTRELELRLKEVVVHLDEPAWEPWLSDLELLAQPPRDRTRKPVPALQQRKRVADAINHFMADDRPRAQEIADEIKAYREHVKAAGLSVDSPVLRMHGLTVCATLFWNLLCLIVLLPLAMVGVLHHLAPFVLVRGIASRLDQPGRKTVSTNRLLVGVPIYLLWYIAVGWWMFDYFATWFAATWMIAAPFTGVLALSYWRRASRTVSLLWHQLRVTVRRSRLLELRRQEADLRGKLKEMAEEYAAKAPRPETELRRNRKGPLARATGVAFLLLCVAAILWVGKYWFFDKPLSEGGLDLTTFSDAQLAEHLDSDEKTLQGLIVGLEKLEKDAIQLNDEFEDGKRAYTNQRDNDDVRELLRRYVTFRQGLLRIVWKYQRSGELEKDPPRLRAFLLGYTAAALLYETGLKFVHMFDNSPKAIAKLNEAEPNWEIPPGLYDTIRRNLASPENSRMFAAARSYYHQQHVQELFEKHGLKNSNTHGPFHAAIAGAEETIQKIDKSLPEKVVEVAAVDLGRLLQDVQYETQSAVSTWIGDFKIREPRNGESLIDKDQLARLGKLLEPGDILLERRNWYLSNAFLPGYWPHGAVYVGTVEDLRRLGLEDNEHVRKHWEKFARKGAHGHQHVIIEAVSEGVIFSSLEHSIGAADSVAVLRPNVSGEEKKEAIARAFSFAGRPYDFEFDFETTDMLVCTEVVYRAYGGNSPTSTIRFPLEKIMGRWTMPAINLVKKFDDEWTHDRDHGTNTSQFEFIAFIDGDEATGTSKFKNVEAFRETRYRSNSSFGRQTIGPFGWLLLSLTVLSGVVGISLKLVGKTRRAAL